jgi:hypothetical protein
MRASAANRQYLGQNTLRDLDAEYAAGGAANQSHAPQAARPGSLKPPLKTRKSPIYKGELCSGRFQLVTEVFVQAFAKLQPNSP